MSGVPYTFGNATTTIALSNLDTNFATPVTIGNTTVGLGNTITTIGNLTLTNVNIASGTSNVSSSIISNGTSNVSVTSLNGNIVASTNGTTAVTIDTNQNVGIGVTPSATTIYTHLSVANQGSGILSYSGNNDIKIASGVYYNSGYKYGVTGYAISMFEQTNGVYRWQVAPSGTAGNTITFTQAMTLDNSGNWYLGTTGTITGFYGSQAQVYANNTNGINLAYNGSGTSGINIWGQYASGTIYFQLYYGGAAGSRGQVGSITYNGTVMALNTGSDRRLKSNITNITNSGEFIDSLTPRAFTWTAQNVNDYGFIADEFQNVRPNDVIGEANAVDSDGKPVYQQANFNSPAMIAMLVAEIQSLRARLKAANIA